MEDKNIEFENEPAGGKINIGKILKVFLSRWYWIAACIALTVTGAYVYLKFTPEVFSTGAIIRMAETKTTFTELVNLGDQSGGNNETEMFILKSQSLLESAVEKLDYPVAYYVKGRVKDINVYPKKPFPVEIVSADSLIRGILDFEILRKDASTFHLKYKKGGKEVKRICKFGQVLSFGNLKFIVREGIHMGNLDYKIHFNSIVNMVPEIRRNLNIISATKSSIITLKLTGSNPVLIADIVNSIVSEYIKNDADRKRQAATQTIDFIDSQLELFSEQRNKSQTALEDYKRNNDIVNLSSKAQTMLTRINTNESRRNELEIERLFINQLESELKQNRHAITLNLGVGGQTESLLSSLIANLNALIKDRNIKIEQFDEHSSIIQIIDEQIEQIKLAAINNTRLLKERNNKTIAFLDNEIAEIKQQLKGYPTDEQNLFNLQSNFDIKEKVYTFLNEKKLESEISRAATVANSSLVESAKPNFGAISPISASIYQNAVVFGLMLGLGLIFLVRSLSPYIHDHAEVQINSTVPILGMIKKHNEVLNDDDKQSLTLLNSKSAFAEAIRSVRTNLSFMQSDQSSKVICITSEVAGEGKSFVSVNLSNSLCLMDKKVILIAADLRRSRLHKTFDLTSDHKGLSEYLSNQSELTDIINKTPVENLSFISSGKIPPNPSELLHRDKMKELLAILKKEYDYVIVDTAPIGLISDAIPLIQLSDINIFVVRSGVSKISAVKLPARIDKEYRMNKSCIIMNAFEPNAFHASFFSSEGAEGNYNSYYYADYNYHSPYYDDEPRQKPLWKRIFGR
ncbi:GumC family protein [Mucilaginibacter terrae]|uniref:non-specific protein-tyrosine kinase n=1 Tax=Mucilaginibacter terrae TaxID=1955052 RepID=A0ABU3H1J9_9SPHI|nr:polysaccharide biosynthesis tyrosine autokinase [Mucilaginibacter terrae]MDT3404795.1 tyrosine-protein kinase Etk/Wzc [Mucilaginibacter terrae]